jgi:hypothetical protein
MAFGLLGATAIAFVPGWRVTWANLLWFTIGAFPGALLLAGVSYSLVSKLPHGWEVQSRDAANLLGLFILAVGATIGGLALVWIRVRGEQRRRRSGPT